MSLFFLGRAKPLLLSSFTFRCQACFSPLRLPSRSFHATGIMSEPEKKIETDEDLERKKKKEEKAREKELKKQKALEKAKLAELKAKQAKDGTNAPKKSSKKSAKRDASEDNPQDFVDPETPLGERKRLSAQMAKQYSPDAVEKSWYAWWEKSCFFKADSKSSKPPFVIVLPPPNVTGALHIGHALTSAIEDTIIRWKRMSGYNALWVPGVDHAGIATQVVVEKKLMRERHMTRHDLGREEFVKEVWKWKNEYGGTILGQQRRLGASLDWSRECFTMDEQRSRAVTEAFVRLYKEGLIYRDLRLVNWDCILRTAISDIEVDYTDIKERTLLKVPGYEKPVEFGVLTSFAYPLEGGLGEVVVATTRVETMLGDTAIAIHPNDVRYKHLHGKFAIHPFNGRKLPIICDAILVDPEFGTGCVKITPAHDPNDFEVGKRHNLQFINIFTDDGKINTNGGPEFTGMARFAAREAVVEALEKKGLYRGAKNNEMRLGLCSRTGDVIEPMIKPQWYVNCSTLGKEALDAAINDENKKLEFIPKQYTAEWKRWLENIRDWCISRQLWWGHRIPAWYATLEDDQLKELGAYSDHWVVARNQEEARKEAALKFAGKKFELSQDPDVLDTWFSSGLFPLSVLGWPDETDDFRAFYPTSVLETGHDILFFWVARMVMLGMKLGGDVPFSKVYLHPMIRDAHGRKMSKSLGNVIDPLEVINGVTLEGLHKRLEEGNLDPKELVVAKEGQVKDFPNGIPECGADALRFALVSYTAQSDKINLDILRVVGYRQWCNKLWNAVRFAMMKLGEGYTPLPTQNPETMPFSCKWILSVLNKAVTKTVESLNAYEFSDAANTVYAWWQYQFCDIYIEAIKPYFAGDNPAFASERVHAQHALWVCLETGLRLLHPFMPFVTEELWQRLPSPKDYQREASIMICDYPSTMENWTNETVETEMETVLATVRSLRALRAELLEKQKNERLPAFALCENNSTSEIVKSHELEIRTLANLSSLEVLLKGEHSAPAGSAVETVNENLKVYLKVDGAINAEAEREKIRNKKDEIQKQTEKLKKMMSVNGYEEKVPAHIKEENATKLTKLLQEFNFFEKESVRLDAETTASGQHNRPPMSEDDRNI
ncbi:PREDICTED: valine--tRNA ligase, mitochondrial 1-like [Tarenaya hassleriana]|uniref:valine--tRNA ligase, mitochondrial 1-like n=1 Tax=Tarenaya hassleriana TaxID=28532 RepID=UPI00053C4C11|nr:PREDICTED: valine--tRNA ligase, mitochondrial 1-like [Tarenaya hassleriana]